MQCHSSCYRIIFVFDPNNLLIYCYEIQFLHFPTNQPKQIMPEVATIKSWINTNASPFAWQRILFKLLPEFKKEGFFLHTIKDDSALSITLLEKISEALFDTYKLELSRDFFKNTTKTTVISESDKKEEKLNQNEIVQDDNEDAFRNDATNFEDLAQ